MTMNRTSQIIIVLSVAVLSATRHVQAADVAAHPVKTRLVPRPLPGGAGELGGGGGVEERLVRKPSVVDLHKPGAAFTNTEEKARIGAIIRRSAPREESGKPSARDVPVDASPVSKERKAQGPSRGELSPLRPGEIRVHPKT